MRVAFVGATRFGLRCLKKINQMLEINVVGIITNEKRFTISFAPDGMTNILHADFDFYANQNRIPLYCMRQKMTEPALLKKVSEWSPDLLLVVGWYHMVPQVLRNIAPAAGLHAALLPDYSGGSPLVWALINGERQTGITFFFFKDGVDSGPIIGQKQEPIYEDDTIATLYARIERCGLELLEEKIPELVAEKVELITQDESKRKTYPPRTPEDGKIDWNWPAEQIYNFIRAQTKPYPGAFTTYNGKRFTVWAANLIEQCDLSPRYILSDLDRLIVGCGKGCIQILEFNYESETFSKCDLANFKKWDMC